MHWMVGEEAEQPYLCIGTSRVGEVRSQCARKLSCFVKFLNKRVYIISVCTSSAASLEEDTELLDLMQAVQPLTKGFAVLGESHFPYIS